MCILFFSVSLLTWFSILYKAEQRRRNGLQFSSTNMNLASGHSISNSLCARQFSTFISFICWSTMDLSHRERLKKKFHFFRSLLLKVLKEKRAIPKMTSVHLWLKTFLALLLLLLLWLHFKSASNGVSPFYVSDFFRVSFIFVQIFTLYNVQYIQIRLSNLCNYVQIMCVIMSKSSNYFANFLLQIARALRFKLSNLIYFCLLKHLSVWCQSN